MIAYIKGELAIKARGYVVIDVGGVGYKILMLSLIHISEPTRQ